MLEQKIKSLRGEVGSKNTGVALGGEAKNLLGRFLK